MSGSKRKLTTIKAVKLVSDCIPHQQVNNNSIPGYMDRCSAQGFLVWDYRPLAGPQLLNYSDIFYTKYAAYRAIKKTVQRQVLCYLWVSMFGKKRQVQHFKYWSMRSWKTFAMARASLTIREYRYLFLLIMVKIAVYGRFKITGIWPERAPTEMPLLDLIKEDYKYFMVSQEEVERLYVEEYAV